MEGIEELLEKASSDDLLVLMIQLKGLEIWQQSNINIIDGFIEMIGYQINSRGI